jgi:hypothetical protein
MQICLTCISTNLAIQWSKNLATNTHSSPCTSPQSFDACSWSLPPRRRRRRRSSARGRLFLSANQMLCRLGQGVEIPVGELLHQCWHRLIPLPVVHGERTPARALPSLLELRPPAPPGACYPLPSCSLLVRMSPPPALGEERRRAYWRWDEGADHAESLGLSPCGRGLQGHHDGRGWRFGKTAGIAIVISWFPFFDGVIRWCWLLTAHHTTLKRCGTLDLKKGRPKSLGSDTLALLLVVVMTAHHTTLKRCGTLDLKKGRPKSLGSDTLALLLVVVIKWVARNSTRLDTNEPSRVSFLSLNEFKLNKSSYH